MREAHGGVRRIDALAAGPGGAVDVDLHVLVFHLDVHVLGLGQDRDGDRRGVNATARLRGGDALDAVHPALELEPTPRAAALDEQDDLLEPADAGGVGIHHLHLPPLPLRVLAVHPQEIRGEQRRLVSPRPRADLQEDVSVVVRIARDEQRPQLLLESSLLLLEVVDLRLGHLAHFPVGIVGEDVAGFGDAGEHALVVAEPLDRIAQLGRRFGRAGIERGLCHHGRVGELMVQLAPARLDLAELVKHRGPSGGRGATGQGCAVRRATTGGGVVVQRARAWWRRARPYPCSIAFLLYLRWKRSTRPAVSTNRCFPVKKG